jgi:putative N6-adenine-specific DNA methylase
MKDAIPSFPLLPTPHSPLPTPSSPAGFILTNPPYGKRLGDQAASEQIYREMANLGQRFPGWKLALITDHSGFESFFGKKADSCREMSNGAIPSYFYQYEIL